MIPAMKTLRMNRQARRGLESKGHLHWVKTIELQIKNNIMKTASLKRSETVSREIWRIINSKRKEGTHTDFEGLQWTCFAFIRSNKDPQRPTLSDLCVCETPTFIVYHVFRTLVFIKRSSTGFEEIPLWPFTRQAHRLLEIVTLLFNFCLKNGRFPSATKAAKVVLLSNMKFSKKAGDFGLVSVTPSLAGVCKNFSVKFFFEPNSSNNLNKNQFGLRKMGSITYALIAILKFLVERENLGYDHVGVNSSHLPDTSDQLRHLNIIEALRGLKPTLNLLSSKILLVLWKVVHKGLFYRVTYLTVYQYWFRL